MNVVWSSSAYWRLFGGDPEIHIIFARNFLLHHPLQFNPGEFTSGETSPLFMMLVAVMYLAVGVYVPIAMKVLGVASLLAVCVLIAREARSQGASVTLAAVLGVLPLLLPSTIFQAFLGMENMLFACLVVLVVRLWLAPLAGSCVRPVVALVALPLMFFLRPEAVLLWVCLTALALADRDWRNVFSLGIGALITLLALWALENWTGVSLEAAGEVRAAFSRLDSAVMHFLGVKIYLSGKLAPALIYCAPFGAVVLLLWRSIGWRRDEVIIFTLLFCAPLLLHLFVVFPSTHFSRYFLYGYAFFFFLFARLMARAEGVGVSPAPAILTAVILVRGTLVPFEHVARGPIPSSTVDMTIEQFSPAFVRANSDALYDALGHPPVPVVVALQEVQIRGRLDERFVVRSLDGIVDSRLLSFVRDGWVDHIGYLKARDVGYLFDLPDYNRDRGRFALAQLSSLGDRSMAGGLCIRRISLSPEPPVGLATVYAIVRGTGC